MVQHLYTNHALSTIGICPSNSVLGSPPSSRAMRSGTSATALKSQGANGQGESVEESKENLTDAITLILKDRREDAQRGLPADAIQDVVSLLQRGLSFRSMSAIMAVFKREGRSHWLWMYPRTGAMQATSEHTEIGNQLAQKICQSLSIPSSNALLLSP